MESGGDFTVFRVFTAFTERGRLDRRLDMRFSRLGCTMPRSKGEGEEG
jgi:hypothetical protein